MTPWEPRRDPREPDPDEDRGAFAARCAARAHEFDAGTGYGFGAFTDGGLIGEVTLANVRRGPALSGILGYWVDVDAAGRGLAPEGSMLMLRFAFETLGLERVEAGVIPRNSASLRVMDKLGMADEGIARGMLEINGRREDHRRFSMLAEEWVRARDDLLARWVL